MKRLLYLFALLNALVLRAQTDSLTVHVEGQPLADLLTDEQKLNVNYLFITGTLADEYYAFLRENNLPKFHELNLRKADIDTIPKKAFYKWEYTYELYDKRSIVLPEQLASIGDSAFFFSKGCHNKIVVTGIFPTIGFDILNPARSFLLIISDDNPFCHMENKNIHQDSPIVSKDKKKLYFSRGCQDIPDGIEIIKEKAFQGNMLTELEFPKSLNKIEDYAFYDCEYPFPTGDSYFGEFIFQTEFPPMLGKDVFGYKTHFYFTMAILTVPERCYENYINADEQWKVFKKDKSELSIEGPNTQGATLQVKKESTGWLVSSEKSIHKIQLYNVSGMLINEIALNGAKEYVIPHQDKVTLCILRVLLDNGEEFTVKL